jgi:DHA1 family quinolone resistance protein-like MFS transporter
MDNTHKKLGLLVLSDIFILSSFGLIGPIFAVFIMENLVGGSIVTAGLATTIFLVVKSVVQLPLAKYFVDKHNHKARFLVIGTFLIILVPFIYVAAKSVYTIFIAQAIYGLGAALAYPAWFSLFTIYMDKKQRGFEYSVYTTAVGISIAIAAFLGAKIAEIFGFKLLFFFVGGIAFIGFLFLLALYKLEMKKAKSGKFPNHPFNKIRK